MSVAYLINNNIVHFKFTELWQYCAKNPSAYSGSEKQRSLKNKTKHVQCLKHEITKQGKHIKVNSFKKS